MCSLNWTLLSVEGGMAGYGGLAEGRGWGETSCQINKIKSNLVLARHVFALKKRAR